MTVELDVSRETLAALKHYASLLKKWNPKINLVSKSSMELLWDRHIWDSAQIFPYATRSGLWMDIGSGAGFPGLVVAILATEKTPERRIVLVESDVRKCAFLRTVVQELSLNVHVISKRAEDIPPVNAEVISARALADLTMLLGFCERHLAAEGVALFMKGETWEKEVDDARSMWSFDLQVHRSKTHPDAAVLEIKDILRV